MHVFYPCEHPVCNTIDESASLMWDNVEIYARARQATGDNVIRNMEFAH
jgi:hypothetical protein